MSAQIYEDFIDKVQYLHEPEYGDFKRKLGNYIARLARDVDPKDTAAKRALADLKTQIIYRPTGNVEEARRLAIETASRLKSSH